MNILNGEHSGVFVHLNEQGEDKDVKLRSLGQ